MYASCGRTLKNSLFSVSSARQIDSSPTTRKRQFRCDCSAKALTVAAKASKSSPRLNPPMNSVSGSVRARLSA